MKIYHGSKVILEEVKVKGSNPTNDYGPAFYVTTDLSAAKSWACRNDSAGVVNEYEIDSRSFQNLKILDLTDKGKFSVFNWLAILMHFRKLNDSFKRDYAKLLVWLEKFYIDIDEYDVIKGYRADDAYFRFPLSAIMSQLAIEDLEEVFMLGELGVQYAFISKRAINLLHFTKVIPCEDKFIGEYLKTIQEATKKFNAMLGKSVDPKKHFMLDLWRKDNE